MQSIYTVTMATAKEKQELLQKKDLARLLYLNSKLSQKEICTEVGISEVTMSTWVRDNKWGDLKNNLTITDAEQIASLERLLQGVIEEGNRFLEDDDPTTNPDADKIIKLAKAIAYLKNKSGAGQMYETGMAFLQFLQREDPELAKTIAPLFMAFIKENL